MRAPAGILLAAGRGARFGGPKALAELHGELLVERGVRTLSGGGCAPVVVVLGAEAAAVCARADLSRAEVVVNPAWASGQASSLHAGLEALAGRAPAAVVALVDQPLVTSEVVRRLVAAWHRGASVAVAHYAGHPRNPVLFDASVWDAVTAETGGDEGARVWLHAHPDRVTPVECGAVGSPEDIDTPADLSRLASGEQTSEHQPAQEELWN